MQQPIKPINSTHLTDIEKKGCSRLLHSFGDKIQADVYGEVLWVYWYKDTAPTLIEQESLFSFAKSLNKKTCIRHMINRGQGVGGKENEKIFFSEDCPEQWNAYENNIQYILKRNSGFSPGLFLDQGQNRNWVLNHSEDKKILNLFSYTSGFSVAAGLGKAKEIVTVDASSSFLEWSKENFKLNSLNPDNYEFYCQDVPLFLSGALKRNRKWDLIICDPPSFGRTKTTIWKIEKDLTVLAENIFNCLNQNGIILFTCNYDKWALSEVIKNFTFKLKKGSFKINPLPINSNFSEDQFQNISKGFFLQKLP